MRTRSDGFCASGCSRRRSSRSVLGTWIGGTDAGWSAAIGIAVVFANFVAHGWSLALAATISPTVLYAVGLGGFVVRLGIIVVVIALLDQTAWFSVVAFIAALCSRRSRRSSSR